MGKAGDACQPWMRRASPSHLLGHPADRRRLGGPAFARIDHLPRHLLPSGCRLVLQTNLKAVSGAELDDLRALRPGGVAVRHVAADEEAVACHQRLIAQLDAAGDDVVEAIAVVAVERQREPALEPQPRQAHARAAIGHVDLLAAALQHLRELRQGREHVRRIAHGRHALALGQRGRCAAAEDLEAGALIWVVGHGRDLLYKAGMVPPPWHAAKPRFARAPTLL
ncbi:hypothetical protein NOVOSPHI9U_40763 [Novosphingobium sp. 9U]|nr:hypothetical protein NOVOSPHI9U_40763 [Novosphingobium sp. 9U]